MDALRARVMDGSKRSMKYEDEHAAYHAHEEDRMIQTSELKAQEAEMYQGIGKACYEAYFKWIPNSEPQPWHCVNDTCQTAWVEAAKAAVRANQANNGK